MTRATAGSPVLGDPRPVRIVLPPEPLSVPAARRFLVAALGPVAPAVLDAAKLVVSELATNCVIHAHTEFELALLRDAAGLRVEVTDHAAGRPTPACPTPQDQHGRGLRIVELLATAWGTLERVDGGKTVWFTMALAAEASGHPGDAARVPGCAGSRWKPLQNC